MRFKSIKTRLVFTIGFCFLVIILALTIYSGDTLRRESVGSAKENALSFAHDFSGHIKAEIEVALDAARTLAQTLSAVKDSDSPLDIGRDQINCILKTILRENESFVGVYTLWEPDAFDQMDSSYAGLEGHDATGRFIPYWSRGSEGFTLAPLVDYATEGVGDYYQVPRSTKCEAIIEPYLYPVQGEEVLITSLVVPIIHEGTFYGIAGVDIKLDTIQGFVDDADFYEGKAEINIISNNGLIVVASGRPELQGKDMSVIHKDSYQDIVYIKSRTSVVEEDEGRFAVFTPIEFGRTTSPWAVNINIPTDIITAEAEKHILYTVTMGIVIGSISLILIYLLVGKLVAPLLSLTKIAEKVAVGDLDCDNTLTSNDEVGKVYFAFSEVVNSLKEITTVCEAVALGDYTKKVNVRSENDVLSKSINQMSETLQTVVKQANSIAKGDYSTDIIPRSEVDELGVALANMTTQLRETIEENQRENWVKNGKSQLYDKMRGEHSMQDMAQNIITHLAKYLDAKIGAIYLKDEDDTLKMAGSYAYTRRKGISHEYKVGEGLVGQSVLEKKTIVVTDVPEDYVVVQSGVGQAAVTNVVIMPLLYDNEVTGAIELGSFHDITDDQLDYLSKVANNIAISINGTQSRVKMVALLAETQRQSEELQSQQEQLRATNEELEEHTEKLKSSEETLKAQQEELELSNAQMEEKTIILEEQKDELEQSWSQVQAKSKELEASNKYKSEFLSNMSHELRTPLNSLLILSKMFAENVDGNLTEDQVESAKVIHEGGSDLLSLINEILDLSKIEAGKMQINIEKARVQNIVGSLQKNFAHFAGKKCVDLKTEIQEGTPEFITTDSKRLKQVLKNLLSNAFKFTSAGSVTISVGMVGKNIDLSHSGLVYSKSIAFAVCDTGIGISKEKQEMIFQAFQQADGTIDREYGGTGLGLSISKEMSQLLGGEIQLESEEGKGSTFTLYLPISGKENVCKDKVEVEMSDDSDADEMANCQSVSASHIAQRPAMATIDDDRDNISDDDKVILIVEDDERFAKILADISHEKGFKCLVAGDGETGVQFAIDRQPEAIILDVGLPGMDGFSVIDKLKDNPKTRHIPVHFMSARDERQSEAKALTMGAIGYITKPVSKEQLDGVFDNIRQFISGDIKKLLVAENNTETRETIVDLIGSADIEIATVSTGQEAYELLKTQKFDCMVLDPSLPDISGFEFLTQMKDDNDIVSKPPVVIYSGKDLSSNELKELKEYAGNVIVKGAQSPETLMDETSLFLHRVETSLPQQQQRMIRMAHDKETILQNKKVLVVDDDMRNVFALSHALKSRGMNVLRAENGLEALDILEANDDVDIVLMDITMPVMDGYETMRRIRAKKKYWKLPILALTAKAMDGDREKCIEAGANDYLAKPIDVEKVLSMFRVWLYM
ncbi:MAG: response regulator [Planctomycetes bacterium]|nr:response regulator [Planctomycetota bacterium]